jgi:hypothetical protein
MVIYHIQNWEDSYNQTLKLYEDIKKSNFHPDAIIGVARGGWVPARLLSDFFSIKETANIKVEAYHSIGESSSTPIITQNINAKLSGKNVLIVDDIADSGKSLSLVITELEKMNVNNVKVATLFYKNQSIIKPDFFIYETSKWVVFPWEYYETIEELTHSWVNNLTNSEISYKLKEIGFPASIVNSYFISQSD